MIRFSIILLSILFYLIASGIIQNLLDNLISFSSIKKAYALSEPSNSNNLKRINSLKKIRQNIGSNDSVLLADSSGRILFSKNGDKKLVPLQPKQPIPLPACYISICSVIMY